MEILYSIKSTNSNTKKEITVNVLHYTLTFTIVLYTCLVLFLLVLIVFFIDCL